MKFWEITFIQLWFQMVSLFVSLFAILFASLFKNVMAIASAIQMLVLFVFILPVMDQQDPYRSGDLHIFSNYHSSAYCIKQKNCLQKWKWCSQFFRLNINICTDMIASSCKASRHISIDDYCEASRHIFIEDYSRPTSTNIEIQRRRST